MSTLNYRLIKRSFVNQKSEKVYTASVMPGERLDLDAILDKVAARSPILHQSLMRMVVEEIQVVIARELAKGNTVNINGIGTLIPSIKGTFAPEKTADNASIKVGVGFKPAVRLVRDVNLAANPQKVAGDPEAPTITAVTAGDQVEEAPIAREKHGSYTLKVFGFLMDYDREDPKQGFTFVSPSIDGKEEVTYPIPNANVHFTHDLHLHEDIVIIAVPKEIQIPQGSYRLRYTRRGIVRYWVAERTVVLT